MNNDGVIEALLQECNERIRDGKLYLSRSDLSETRREKAMTLVAELVKRRQYLNSAYMIKNKLTYHPNKAESIFKEDVIPLLTLYHSALDPMPIGDSDHDFLEVSALLDKFNSEYDYHDYFETYKDLQEVINRIVTFVLSQRESAYLIGQRRHGAETLEK